MDQEEPIEGQIDAIDYLKDIENQSGKIFYTKCGRAFKKSTNASTTGYEYKEEDPQCNVCPFREKSSRYRQGVNVEVRECRAGEQEPNSTNDYHTSDADNSTNLNIKSIDWNWIEGIREECESLESVASAYYIQDASDCRKVLSVSFKNNKKGIQTKKELINKYFN